VHSTRKLKQLSKLLLAAKKSPKEAFLKSILGKESKCWCDSYKYVKSVKEIRKIFPPSRTRTGG